MIRNLMQDNEKIAASQLGLRVIDA